MTPRDPSGPVPRVSPAVKPGPCRCRKNVPRRVTVAEPAQMRTTPMIPSVSACPKHRHHTAAKKNRDEQDVPHGFPSRGEGVLRRFPCSTPDNVPEKSMPTGVKS